VNLLWQGILLGLGLSVLVGPMLFLYLQIGIEKGFKEAFFLGLGSWISDLLFILAVYFSISFVLKITAANGFTFWMGILGGIILMVIGGGLLLHKPPHKLEEHFNVKKNTTYFGFWLKGFFINTFNPFAIFFWISVMSGFSTKHNSGKEALILFSSILGTIIVTDLLKILLAKQLKKIITGRAINIMHKIVGTSLILLAIVLIYRVS
jgi:threonine/homoserine/homoserine lactone efflux protein